MSERVLIIDDEEHIRRMMRLTLESAGYVAGEAGDGLEGVRLFMDGPHWDAVVLDQRMPGMDGLETLRRIREEDPQATIVMATAFASIELAVEAMKLGASDFVRKPLTPETLRNAVRAALAKRIVPTETPSTPRQSIIETVTMNGFGILDQQSEPDQRRFTVVDPNGERLDVTVAIDGDVISYVERMIRKPLPEKSSFWTSQARRLLSDYLWSKGAIPPTRSLTLSEISRDELPIAEKWEQD